MKYVVSEEIRTLLGTKEQENGKEAALEKCVTFSELESAQARAGGDKSVLYFIANTTPVLEEVVEPTTKTAEYVSLMARLRAEQQEREYRSYLSKERDDMAVIDAIGAYRHEPENRAPIAREVNYQLTTVVNVLLTTGSTGYALWYWTGTSTHMNHAYRVLLSLAAALLVLVAEVVIFNGYLRRVDDSRRRERAKVEQREVVERLEFVSGSATGALRHRTEGVRGRL